MENADTVDIFPVGIGLAGGTDFGSGPSETGVVVSWLVNETELPDCIMNAVYDARIPPRGGITYFEIKGQDRWFQATFRKKVLGDFGTKEDAVRACIVAASP